MLTTIGKTFGTDKSQVYWTVQVPPSGEPFLVEPKDVSVLEGIAHYSDVTVSNLNSKWLLYDEYGHNGTCFTSVEFVD